MLNVLLPDKFEAGWDGSRDVDVFPVLPLEQLLRDEYSTDAHTACYMVSDEEGDLQEEISRLNVKAVAALRQMGAEVWLGSVFVDIDRKGHQKWATEEQAHKAVETAAKLLPYCAVYATGGGLRVVYKLSQLVRPESFKKIALVALRQVQNAIKAGKDALADLELDDTCTEWSRHYRLPHVVRDGSRTADLAHLHIPSPWASWFPGTSELEDLEGRLAAAYASATPGDRPEEKPEAPLCDDLMLRASVVAYPKLREAAKKIVAGSRFYEQGERNPKTFWLVAAFLSWAAARGELPPAEEIMGTLWDSVSLSTGTQPEEALDETWGMIVRLRARAMAEHAARVEQQEQAVELALERLRVKAVAYTNKTRWIYTPPLKSYGPATTSDQTFLADMTRYHADAVLDSRGKTNPVHVILRDHGVRVSGLRYVLGKVGSDVQDDGRGGKRLEVGIGSLPEVRPVYHEECQEYIEKIVEGDPEYGERFVAWLATAHRLDRATTTLLLRGADSAGKGMIAEALSRYFGGKSTFSKVLGRFNGGMLDSALIHLDEGVDSASQTGSVSNRFREIVGGGTLSVELKGVDPIDVVGNYRIIVTANRPHPIPVANSENMNDFRAIAIRVLPVWMDRSVSEWLRSKGGRDFTEDWVDLKVGDVTLPGKLVEHIAWLAEELADSVVPGDRFLVPTEVTPWHVSALLQGVLKDVLVGVGAAVARNDELSKQAVKVVDGNVYVAANPLTVNIVNKVSDTRYERGEVYAAIKSGLSSGPPLRRGEGEESQVFYQLPAEIIAAAMNPLPELRHIYIEEVDQHNRFLAALKKSRQQAAA